MRSPCCTALLTRTLGSIARLIWNLGQHDMLNAQIFLRPESVAGLCNAHKLGGKASAGTHEALKPQHRNGQLNPAKHGPQTLVTILKLLKPGTQVLSYQNARRTSGCTVRWRKDSTCSKFRWQCTRSPKPEALTPKLLNPIIPKVRTSWPLPETKDSESQHSFTKPWPSR